MAVARILIADDEPEICDMLKGWLSPWTVETAQDGQEALRLLCKQPFDLVILDIKMPYLGGLEVFRAIQEQAIEVDVVFFNRLWNCFYGCESTQDGGSRFSGKTDQESCFYRIGPQIDWPLPPFFPCAGRPAGCPIEGIFGATGFKTSRPL